MVNKISLITSGTNTLLCVGTVFLAICSQVNIFGTILYSRSSGWSPNFFSLWIPLRHVRGGLVILLGSSTSPLHTPLFYTLTPLWSNAFPGRTEMWSQVLFMPILLHSLHVLDTKLSNSRHSISRLETETGTYWQMSWRSKQRKRFWEKGNFIWCQTLQSGPGFHSRPLKPGAICASTLASKTLKQLRKRVKGSLYVATCPFLSKIK